MADSIFELISKNIQSTLDGQSITYNGSSHTITCERERIIDIPSGRYPLVKIEGPIVDVLHRARNRVHCALYYVITMIDDSLMDRYDPDTSVTPATEKVGNVVTDIMKLLNGTPNSRTRGGYANNTEFEGSGYFMENDGESAYMVNFLNIIVTTTVQDTDMYLTGG